MTDERAQGWQSVQPTSGGAPMTGQPPSTTPPGAARHSILIRGLSSPTSSPTREGRFGRMFRNLPVFSQDPESLKALAARMVQDPEDDTPEGQPDEDENPEISAGYTYLGQFIDHDVTFDPVSSLQRQNDPDALVDFRTPRFDLDSVYGRGPSDQPYLYLGQPQARVERMERPVRGLTRYRHTPGPGRTWWPPTWRAADGPWSLAPAERRLTSRGSNGD